MPKNDTTATREWPPACVDSNRIKPKLFEGEIFDCVNSPSVKLHSMDYVLFIVMIVAVEIVHGVLSANHSTIDMFVEYLITFRYSITLWSQVTIGIP